MEQERKIEKLLKAYAKKRRGQAGDSFKLDPATRRILQNEISRNAPASNDDDETMSLWELFRKHWLYLLGFAACIFALAALFLPSTYVPKASSTLSLNKNVKQIPAPTQRPIEDTHSLTPPPAVASDISPAPVPPAQSDKLVTASSGMPAARRDVNGPAPAPETAAPASMPPNPAGGSLAVNSTPADSTEAQAIAGEASKSFWGGFQKDSLKTIASSSQSAAVLVNFRVTQNGSSIRVVDQDGSIYTGSVEADGDRNRLAPGTTSSWSAPAEQKEMAAQNTVVSKTESPKMSGIDSPGANASKVNNAGPSPEVNSSGLSSATTELSAAAELKAPMQKYFFSVQGTNLTLKQSVVFAGTLMEDLSLAADTQQTFGMSANAALGAAYAQQFVRSATTNQPLRIEGIAIIDQTSKIQINATAIPARSNAPK